MRKGLCWNVLQMLNTSMHSCSTYTTISMRMDDDLEGNHNGLEGNRMDDDLVVRCREGGGA